MLLLDSARGPMACDVSRGTRASVGPAAQVIFLEAWGRACPQIRRYDAPPGRRHRIPPYGSGYSGGFLSQ
jgi:hypothetical protein